MEKEKLIDIKKEVLDVFEMADTWTECIEQILSEDDTPLVEAFKLLMIGELTGVIKSQRRHKV